MKLKFCGADQGVTGSCHMLVLDDGFSLLMDAGMHQGKEEDCDRLNREWMFDPAKINCLLLSHAHIDHCGRIPLLVKDGFKGRIICTHATKDLAGLMLLDSAKIQERDAEYANKDRKRRPADAPVEPLYAVKDVENAFALFEGVDYDKPFKLTDNITVVFRDAGHIIGSANITVKVKTDQVNEVVFGFTGDIGRPHRPILQDPKSMDQVDYLICESTYGGEEHSEFNADADHLLEIIKNTCVVNKGKLLIPAFSIGRTQEIIYLLDKFANERKLPNIPIFVDSPLAVSATDIFMKHPECFDDELVQYMKKDPDPFGFNGLKYIRNLDDSKALNVLTGPAVIISASGMLNAGRIRHHVFNNIDKTSTTILLVGFCAPGTLGALLRDGVKEVWMFGEKKIVKAKIEVMDSLSAHADQREILSFLSSEDRTKIKALFLVHGELSRQEALKAALEKFGFSNILIPKLGQEFIF
ncbi:MAG: MBL fold metallo-hydrolase [Candidatus Omnitrophica bacterium]|nr:MBL fold metallo-hydrolase [Candidatus Omnitrophota bacterium]